MTRSSCYLTALLGVYGALACGSTAPGASGASDAGKSTLGAQGGAAAGNASSGGAATGEAGAVNVAGAVAGAIGGTGPATSAGAATGGAATTGGQASAGAAASDKSVVFVGGFGADPMHVYDLNRATGALSERLPPIDAGPEPSCLALDPSRTHLYVCNEDDGPGGGVTSFTLDANGSPQKLNHQLGSDLGLTQVVVSPDGKWLAGAGYNGGSASLFPILADGAVGAEQSNVDFGADAQTHYVVFTPNGQFLFATTKGLNAVQQLKLGAQGALLANTPPSVATGNVGPRHMTLHPSGKLLFVVSERGSTVIPYQISEAGTLTPGESVSSLPPDYQGQNSGAHVELGHDAHFLYVSNRGHDSVGVFKVDQQSGALTLVTHAATHSASPHDFDIDAAGEILITANRKGNTLSVFKIETDGTLTALGNPVPTRTEPTAVLIY
jgi:6-phosphogluconolactonase